MPKRKSLTAPKRRPDDSAAFKRAHDFLEKKKIHYRRPSDHQLKIGDVNFYPGTGKITIDREPNAARTGDLEMLEKLLVERRKRLDAYVAHRKAQARSRPYSRNAAD